MCKIKAKIMFEADNTDRNNEEDLPIDYITRNPSEQHSAYNAFDRLLQRIDVDSGMILMRKRLTLLKFTTIAASIALLVTTFLLFNKQTSADKDIKVFYTAAGQSQQLTLPDGSKVWANADTRLVLYPESFEGDKRVVYVSGEAFFDVVKDKKRPFIVKTDKLDITVLGTKFNVKSYPDEANIETTLAEGLINIEGNDAKKFHTQLLPNQQLVLRKSDGKLALYENIELKYYTGWKDGELYFSKASIEDIARKLERTFNVKVYVESKKLRERKFTGKFDKQETIEEILNTIKLTTPYNYYKQDNTIVMRD